MISKELKEFLEYIKETANIKTFSVSVICKKPFDIEGEIKQLLNLIERVQKVKIFCLEGIKFYKETNLLLSEKVRKSGDLIKVLNILEGVE